jgi:hypothetical protein
MIATTKPGKKLATRLKISGAAATTARTGRTLRDP